MKKVISISATFVALLQIVNSQGIQRTLKSGLGEFCGIFYNVLPMVILVIIVLAGVVFAVGQTMGAETRARANVWATNLLIGAIIAGIVIVLAPSFLGFLIPGVTTMFWRCST